MARKPEDRYNSALGLAEDVRRWLDDEPVDAYREPFTSRTGRWMRRHRTLATTAGGVLLVLTISAVIGASLLGAAHRRLGVAYAAEKQRRLEARRALDDQVPMILEELLTRQQVLTEDHKEYLRRAMRAYEQFAADTAQDQESRAGVAGAYTRVAKIRGSLSLYRESEQAYRRAIQLFQQLVIDYKDQPSYREGLAVSYNNLGATLGILGDHQGAEEAYRGSLCLFERLVADYPAHAGYQQALASHYNNLGWHLANTGSPKEAETAYRDSLDRYQKLIERFPNVPDYVEGQAKAYNNLAFLLRDGKRLPESEQTHRMALALRQRLTQEYPRNPQYRRDLAQSFLNLGNVLMNANPTDRRAAQAFDEAVVLLKKLAAEFPSRTEYLEELARAYNNRSNSYQLPEQFKEAENDLRLALSLRRNLADDFPDVPNYRNDLAGTLVNIAYSLAKTKKPEQARELLLEAQPHHRAALKSYPKYPTYRRFFRNNLWQLSNVLIDLGDHRGAAEAVKEWAAVPVDGKQDTYLRSRALARCIPLAERDSRLSEDRRRALMSSYGDQAMSLLRQAADEGYRDAAEISRNPDLAVLRSRKDFRWLLDTVKGSPEK